MSSTHPLEGSELTAPERNNYFYGMLLTRDKLEKEQKYFRDKIDDLYRCIIGSGVICGLNLTPDPANEGRICIMPGKAVDRHGRQIVVPEGLSIDPSQPTDDRGEAEGEPIDAGVVEICLAYSETFVDLVPVLIPECDTPEKCAPCTIREGVRVLVRVADEQVPEAPTCEFSADLLSDAQALHDELCRRASEGCPEPPEDDCVTVGLVRLPLTDDSIDSCAGRPLIYGSNLLFNLVLCVLERFGAATSPGRFLRYESGDGQAALPGDPVPNRLRVQVVDVAGAQITDIPVDFSVEGGGTVAPASVRTDAEGFAEAKWVLGEAGPQRVTARAEGGLFTVTFTARLERE